MFPGPLSGKKLRSVKSSDSFSGRAGDFKNQDTKIRIPLMGRTRTALSTCETYIAYRHH